MKKLLFILFVLFVTTTFAQTIERVEPPFWWVGMNNTELQLLVYGKDIAETEVSLSKYTDVKIVKIHKVKNPNYLFVDLEIGANAKAGTFVLNFKKENKIVLKENYILKQRREGSATRQGFQPSDVMYLITPDRFANGDPSNDSMEGLPDKLNRSDKDGRHGGDIQGIINSLDYLDNLGFTSIWLNPVLENNMQEVSYHGYSTTDYYKIDPRYGTNEKYQELSKKAKEKGIGLIMDVITNHCGSEHWWIKDFPTDDWVNYQKEFEKGEIVYTSHRKSTIQDPYVTQVDKEKFTDGWFVKTMPDLNQRNPFMAKYLTQNSIWWIEFADLHGLRVDTYPYSDASFMRDWSCAVMSEFPNFNIVGEEWHGNHNIVAYWQGGRKNHDGYTSCLPSLMDFPMQENLSKALTTSEEGWSDGWQAAYESLANDHVYADPYNLVILPDNHDMKRFYSQVNEDYDLFKLGIAYYLTMRGIPQIYYGTEIIMSSTEDHGNIRTDFPGGWKGDKVNAMTGEGLNDLQSNAQQYFKNLLNWRKTSDAIHNGKILHYQPKEGIYVYFRYTDSKKVMVVLSKNEENITLDMDWYKEGLGDAKEGKEVISGKVISLEGKLIVPAKSPMVIEIE
jgi:glycosidase